MRMRRKRNLEARLEACGNKIIYLDRDEKNFQVKDTSSLLDHKQLFGNDSPVILEIGCGKGQFAIEYAKAHPEVNILAVEKSSNVIVDAAENAIEQQIPNLIFLRGNAEYLNKSDIVSSDSGRNHFHIINCFFVYGITAENLDCL